MAIKMLHNEVLVTATEKEETTAGGIILTGDTTKGSKPALVLEISGDRVFLDWTKVMPIDYDGTAAGIIDVEHIKAVISV
jgi:co-chaperonin GroES (HSP10)